MVATVAKNIEVSADSEISFDDAIKAGIDRVSQTLKGVRGAWVKEQKVMVVDGKVVRYKVIMIVTFVVEALDAATLSGT